jgi:hypothetical protein
MCHLASETMADIAGVDCDAILYACRPPLDRLGGSDDFADLSLEVLGELDISHAYLILAPQDTHRGRCDCSELSGARRRGPLASGQGESSDPQARSRS